MAQRRGHGKEVEEQLQLSKIYCFFVFLQQQLDCVWGVDVLARCLLAGAWLRESVAKRRLRNCSSCSRYTAFRGFLFSSSSSPSFSSSSSFMSFIKTFFRWAAIDCIWGVDVLARCLLAGVWLRERVAKGRLKNCSSCSRYTAFRGFLSLLFIYFLIKLMAQR